MATVQKETVKEGALQELFSPITLKQIIMRRRKELEINYDAIIVGIAHREFEKTKQCIRAELEKYIFKLTDSTSYDYLYEYYGNDNLDINAQKDMVAKIRDYCAAWFLEETFENILCLRMSGATPILLIKLKWEPHFCFNTTTAL